MVLVVCVTVKIKILLQSASPRFTSATNRRAARDDDRRCITRDRAEVRVSSRGHGALEENRCGEIQRSSNTAYKTIRYNKRLDA